jgi:phospholipase/carboxylesterase
MPLEVIELDTAASPRASIIVLHGLGADGNDFVPFAHELDLSSVGAVRFIFPHAPKRPVSVNGGHLMRAWYDIYGPELGTAQRLHEDESGLRASQALVQDLVAREVERGVPASRIVLAGFSQGCAMTFMTGLRCPERLAGLLGMSGYLPLAAQTGAEAAAANAGVPIFQAHGTFDPVITLDRASASRDALTALGHTVEWHAYPMAHTVCEAEIHDVNRWLLRVLH